MLFICSKIKNIAVALLILLVFETTSKKKQKILPCEQSCCCHALGTRKKLQNPLHTNNLVVITPSKHEKKIGAKKNLNFLIEVNNKKSFLDPLRR